MAARSALLSLAVLSALPAAAQTVMSLNVCTDQLAMLLARPGQLLSVSTLADDPALSFLHQQAAGLPKNAGMAEEVFLARPDIVVTGTYSMHNTTMLLRRLGHRVEEFAFEQTLQSIPSDIRRMGELLGNEQQAERLAADFETELETIGAARCGEDPTAIAYDQNGIALGAGTLADSVLAAAGLRNVAAEQGYDGMTPFPLELLVTLRPDIVIVRPPLAGTPALADQLMRHPALRALQGSRIGDFVPEGAWSCGGPSVLEAIRALANLREEVVQCDAREPGH